MGNASKESLSDHRVKPDGGYVHVSTFRFGIAWWAYQQGELTIRAVRVLLALHELLMRRTAYLWTEKKQGRKPDPEFTPHFSTEELASFCGLPEKRARAALKELLELGLVSEFGSDRIFFAQSIDELDLSPEQRQAFWDWLSGVTKRKRVPIPRRILALASEASSPAQIAFILGASLRCIYLHPKKGGFTYSGWLSCSWLSRHFGICLRAAKAAKSHLMELGWVEPQGRVGKFGEYLAINPAWERITATVEATLPEKLPENPVEAVANDEAPGTKSAPLPADSGTKSAPLPDDSGTKSAPPRERESSFGTEQRPRESHRPEAEKIRPGLFQKASEPKTEDPAPKFTSPVRLSNIQPEDFKDLSRSLELFRQAVKCGLSDESEHSRLRWVAAIERARTVPANNPAGLFLFIVKNKKWEYLSEGHWDAANERLKAHLFGNRTISPPLMVPLGSIGSAPSERKPAGFSRPSLSEDAKLIKAMRSVLAERGLRNQDPLPLLRRHDPSWTRERLLQAELEISRPNYLERPNYHEVAL